MIVRRNEPGVSDGERSDLPMRRLLVLGVLIGCGSSSPRPTPAQPTPRRVEPAGGPLTPAAPDEPRVAFAKQVFGALAAGDADALVKLADPIGLYKQIATCQAPEHRGLDVDPQLAYVTAARKRYEWRARADKGLQITVRGLAKDDDGHGLAKGDEIADQCIANQDVKLHRLAVDIRAQRDQNPAIDQTVAIEAIELAGHWYFVGVDHVREKPKPDLKVLVAQLDEFANRMCRCKDKTCADKVQDDVTKWSTEVSSDADASERPDEQTVKQATEIMTRYSDCMTKLMTAP